MAAEIDLDRLYGGERGDVLWVAHIDPLLIGTRQP